MEYVKLGERIQFIDNKTNKVITIGKVILGASEYNHNTEGNSYFHILDEKNNAIIGKSNQYENQLVQCLSDSGMRKCFSSRSKFEQGISIEEISSFFNDQYTIEKIKNNIAHDNKINSIIEYNEDLIKRINEKNDEINNLKKQIKELSKPISNVKRKKK